MVTTAVGYLAWLALASPEVEFLRPSFRGEWIVHPAAPIRFQGLPACPDAIFERRVVLTNLPSAVDVSVTALRGFRMDVNEHAAIAGADGMDWKRSSRVNLLPYLGSGTNRVKVTVFGTNGPSALLVEGLAAFRTGTNWTVRYGSERAKPAVLAGEGESFMRIGDGALWQDKNRRLFGWLFAAYAAFIVYALVPLRLKPWMRGKTADADAVTGVQPVRAGEVVTAGGGRAPGTLRRPLFSALAWLSRHGVCLAILIIVAVAQYRNVSAYPYTRSYFDSQGHVEYLRHAAEDQTVPMATDGWEMFQPPGYYFAAALVYRAWGGRPAEPASLKAVQRFTTTCGLMNLVFALGLLYLLFPDRPLVRNLGFASVAFLPMHFYMAPMITSEVFASAAISGALLVVVWALRSDRPPWIRVAAAALACGFGLLSKYSGLFLCLAVAVWMGLRALADVRSLRRWGVVIVFLAGVLAVSGWYYHRNVAAYGDAFVGNWDRASGFHYEQPPGYRTAGFYTRFGAVFTSQPQRTMWASFWDGQYGSIWADSHGAFLSLGKKETEPYVEAVIVLAMLPAVACLVGFWLAVRRLLRTQWDDPLLAVVLVAFLTITGVVAFTMEVPTYSTVKGFFLLSLIPAAGVFSGIGFSTMARQLGRLRWIMYGFIVLLGGLVLFTYRYVG